MAMRYSKQFWLAFALAGLLAGNAWADRGYYRPHHHHPRSSVTLGVYVGDPWIYSPYYPYPVYTPRIYVPPLAPIIVSPPPTVYVERPAVSVVAPTLEPGFWYYCADSQAYYPYVKQCAGSWQKVAPQPAE
jgi:hypothetical protein